MMISAILLALSKWSLSFGSYAAYIFDRKQREKIEHGLAATYVAVTDFNPSGFVEKTSSRYVDYLHWSESRGKWRRELSILKILATGILIGLVWAILTWVGLNETLWSIPAFFVPGNLNTVLLVGGCAISIVFSVDILIVGLLARAVKAKKPIIGQPAVAVLLCIALALVSWSATSALVAATVLLGPGLRHGEFYSFLLTPEWILQRWGIAASHLINGAMEIKLQSTGRFITSSAFGFPATIASLLFLVFIVAAWFVEMLGKPITGVIAMLVNAVDGIWRRLTSHLPVVKAKTIGRIVAAIFFSLAVWAAIIGL